MQFSLRDFLMSVASVVTMMAASSAEAGLHLHGSAGGGVASTSGVNVGDIFEYGLFPFVNFMKTANGNANDGGVTFIYPNFLAQGTNLPAGTITTALGYTVSLPTTYLGEYVFSAQGTVSGSGFNQGIVWNTTSAFGQIYAKGAGTTLSGCSNSNVPPCVFGNQLSVTGTNPNLTMDFSIPVSGAASNVGAVRLTIPSGINLQPNTPVTVAGVVGSDGNGCGANGSFLATSNTATTADLAGSTFAGGCTYISGGQIFPFQKTGQFNATFQVNNTTISLTSMIMCKLADYTADNTCNTTDGKTAWAGGFNDDYVASLATLRPSHLRFLDYNNAVFSTPVDYNSWQSTNTFSYDLFSFWAITNWFGSATGTNSYAINCSNGTACTYNLTGGAPADGDFFQFYITNANTNYTPTLTITDHSSVTSSAIPLFMEGGIQAAVQFGGTATSGDTVALKFTSSCLAGGQHTTSAYTVGVSDSVANISTQLANIVFADAMLSAQPLVVNESNPLGGNGFFFVGYAINACSLAITAVITGAATETFNSGTMLLTFGGLSIAANTLYTGVYSKLLKGIVLNTVNPGGQRPAWPWITQIQLAQAVATKSGLQVGCWLQPSISWSDASFTSLANLMFANQCSGGSITEISNEVWNGTQITSRAGYLGSSVGLGINSLLYYELQQRRWWAIASGIFGGIAGNFHPVGMYQLTANPISALNGTGLCGTTCSNTAYQNAIGTDYNSAPNRPVDFTRHIGVAPYYAGSMINAGYGGPYSTWTSTGSSVSGNVLTVGSTSGTVLWNQGISSCDGTYIAAPTPTAPYSAQLTGTVSTTLNGAVGNFTYTWTVTSTAGLSAGMWVYNITTGMFDGVIASVNAGAHQITMASNIGQGIYASAGANDSLIFGGLAGTYQLNNTTCSAASGTITGGDVLGLQYAADNYNGLNSAKGSQQDALNWAYQDVLNSSISNNLSGLTTIASMPWAYKIINTVAVAAGVSVWDYEGGYQARPPNTSEATGMGLSSAYGGAAGYVAVLQLAFKNNALFKQAETVRHNTELTYLPVGSQTMWYVDNNGAQWGLYPNSLYFPPPFQSYNAICAYNGGGC